MATKASFEVSVSGGSTSVNEYRRAMSAPKSELPELTAQQKTVAKKLGLSEEEYRRGVLADQFGESRMVERGERLGEIIQSILDGSGAGYRIEALQAEMLNFQWLARITNAERALVIAIPRGLADDALDSGGSEALARLKNCLLTSLDAGQLLTRS